MDLTTRASHASRTRRLVLAAVSTLVALTGCRKGPAEAPAGHSIGREAFISTYVDLRTATIRARPDSLAPETRDSILSEHSLTEDDLLGFVEAHGEDVAYMRDVWDEVEKRLDSVRLTGDETDRRP